MTDIRKPDNSIINDLQSQNTEAIESAINKIKQTSNSQYLPYIINSLNNSTTDFAKNILSKYIFDLKIESAKDILILSLKDPKYKKILPVLVSSCWQNGLSFKDYFIFFTELFIKEDFTVSIEAYSVIENMIDDLSDDEKDLIIKKLKLSMDEMDSTKKSFTESLIDMIYS